MNDRLSEARCLIARALGFPVDLIDDDSSIETLDAWDSLGHLRIVLEIEQVVCAELTGEEIMALDGVQDIARIILGQVKLTS